MVRGREVFHALLQILTKKLIYFPVQINSPKKLLISHNLANKILIKICVFRGGGNFSRKLYTSETFLILKLSSLFLVSELYCLMQTLNLHFLKLLQFFFILCQSFFLSVNIISFDPASKEIHNGTL